MSRTMVAAFFVLTLVICQTVCHPFDTAVAGNGGLAWRSPVSEGNGGKAFRSPLVDGNGGLVQGLIEKNIWTHLSSLQSCYKSVENDLQHEALASDV
ncbi:hypothetical protein C8J57DRAFT_1354099 [Mycena rebaudengoi]|nr:hypothetical protein C8J57DRAFT_1354099 [Mycena rebaudengoi]